MPEHRWRTGDVAVMRHRKDSYRWAAPMRVVEDRGDFVALYLQPGTRYRTPAGDDGEVSRDFTRDTRTVEATWGLHHALHLIRFGDRHATVPMWNEHTWEFRCWYINLQEPLRRTPLGFETMDLTLDALIAPDLSGWQWKDEDEFIEYGIGGGWYSHDDLAELKRYGRTVIDTALAGASPFSDGWEHWRPEPSWQPPSLPVDWDTPAGAA